MSSSSDEEYARSDARGDARGDGDAPGGRKEEEEEEEEREGKGEGVQPPPPPPVTLPPPPPKSMFSLPPLKATKLVQSRLITQPSAKTRLATAKPSGLFKLVEEMHKGGLNVLVCPLNPFFLPGNESRALRVRSVFEARSSSNIQVDVLEEKKAGGKYRSIGFCELFGIVDAAQEAAEELQRSPTTGVVVLSNECGEASKLFVSLVLAAAKSAAAAKRFKAKGGGKAFLKEDCLLDFVGLFKRTAAEGRRAALEDYYYRVLQTI